jgi:aldose 1-epimerase
MIRRPGVGLILRVSDSSPGPGAYRIEEASVDGLRAWVLHDDGGDLHTTWVPDAGMLGASLIHQGEELLWQGAGAGEYAKARAFMGIPFLQPWANRLDHFGYRASGRDVVLDPESPLLLLDDNGLPIHGLLNATHLWSVRQAAAGSDRVRLVAALDFDDPDLLAAFPFPHRLEMAIELGAGGLEVGIALTATGDRAVPVSFGFHPYLQLPGVPRVEWDVAFPVRRRVSLDDRMLPSGTTELVDPITGRIGERTWDDCFDRFDRPPRFDISAGRRKLEVDFGEGYRIAQIFAPPGQDYLCVEPMTAPVNALTGPDDALTWVRAGQRHRASFRIVCQPS